MFHVICQIECCSSPVLALSWLLPLCYSICSAHVHHLHVGLASPKKTPSSILLASSAKVRVRCTSRFVAMASCSHASRTRAGLALGNQISGTGIWNWWPSNEACVDHGMFNNCLNTSTTCAITKWYYRLSCNNLHCKCHGNLCRNSLKQLVLFIMEHYGTAFNHPINHVAASSSYTRHFISMRDITLRPAILTCCMFLVLWLSNPKHPTMNKIMLWSVILTCCVLCSCFQILHRIPPWVKSCCA